MKTEKPPISEVFLFLLNMKMSLETFSINQLTK